MSFVAYLFLGYLNVMHDFVKLLSAYGGSHSRIVLKRIPDLHPLCSLYQLSQEWSHDALVNKHSRAIGTDLEILTLKRPWHF